MKLEPWEPDLRTLVVRIEEGELDLQPEFQRGLVWAVPKQQRLIDTVLRGWAIPPLHLLVLSDQSLAVLDGQQRLRALQMFLTDQVRVGSFDPVDAAIAQYRGYLFSDLPPDVKRRVMNHKVPSYRLYDYEAEEPYELFFRLNLPTGLTQAEKRNALFGSSRAQVKGLVERAEKTGWGQQLLGFANARLAYDDVLARACVCVERGTLRVPLTAANIETYFRSPDGFEEETIDVVDEAVQGLSRALGASPGLFKLNKATVLSWLLVQARGLIHGNSPDLAEAMRAIEVSRGAGRRSDSFIYSDQRLDNPVAQAYLNVYSDRASLRVTDVLSVVTRDAAIWRLMDMMALAPRLPNFREAFMHFELLEDDPSGLGNRFLEILEDPHLWGSF